MNYILFDPPAAYSTFLPFTFSRPLSQIRLGALTLAEKWEKYLLRPVSYLAAPHLQAKFPTTLAEENIWINATVIPRDDLARSVKRLKPDESIRQGDTLVAIHTGATPFDPAMLDNPSFITGAWDLKFKVAICQKITDIFTLAGAEIQADFHLLKKRKKTKPITDPHTIVYQPEQVFLEAGTTTKACVLNAEGGPIYLGKNVSVQEGAVLQGPVSVGEGSVINVGAKIRPNTVIGPYCKVGGEISNSVFFGYSNKAHDGFLGNSVIGEWCNLGADTNNSNLKNNYGEVKIWNYNTQNYQPTGLQFCGLLMGDHSKAGINTMFNTGTVVGFGANIFGGNFPPKHIPSFGWGGADGFETYDLEQALLTAERVMQRRQIAFSNEDKAIFEHIFQETASERQNKHS